MQTDVIKLTYEDYALIPDDGKRHEIIDGDEVVSPSPARSTSASFSNSRSTVRRNRAD